MFSQRARETLHIFCEHACGTVLTKSMKKVISWQSVVLNEIGVNSSRLLLPQQQDRAFQVLPLMLSSGYAPTSMTDASKRPGFPEEEPHRARAHSPDPSRFRMDSPREYTAEDGKEKRASPRRSPHNTKPKPKPKSVVIPKGKAAPPTRRSSASTGEALHRARVQGPDIEDKDLDLGPHELPDGVESLGLWGRTVILFGTSEYGNRYIDVVQDPTKTKYMKWLHDHQTRCGPQGKDFVLYTLAYRYIRRGVAPMIMIPGSNEERVILLSDSEGEETQSCPHSE